MLKACRVLKGSKNSANCAIEAILRCVERKPNTVKKTESTCPFSKLNSGYIYTFDNILKYSFYFISKINILLGIDKLSVLIGYFRYSLKQRRKLMNTMTNAMTWDAIAAKRAIPSLRYH